MARVLVVMALLSTGALSSPAVLSNGRSEIIKNATKTTAAARLARWEANNILRLSAHLNFKVLRLM